MEGFKAQLIMFARLNESGAIDELVDFIPQPPQPLADAQYRQVMDGTRPAMTTKYSWAKEKPVSEWIITPTDAIKQWEEVIPPVEYFRRMKQQEIQVAMKAGANASITVTHATYGSLTFDADSISDLVACAYVCDLEIRANAASRDDMVGLVLDDHSTVMVKCIHALAIVKAVCTVHRNRKLAASAKLRSSKLATTIEQVTSI